MPNEVNPATLSAVYLKIKGTRERNKREFTEQDDLLVKQQDMIRAKLLEICNEQGATSLNTPSGTVIKTTKKKYWTSDWEAMHKFIVENNRPDLLTRSLHQSNLKELLAEKPDTQLPGLNAETEYTITVRKPTKKK